MLKTDLRLIPTLAFMYGASSTSLRCNSLTRAGMSLIDRTDLPSARLNGAELELGLGIGQRYTIISASR